MKAAIMPTLKCLFFLLQRDLPSVFCVWWNNICHVSHHPCLLFLLVQTPEAYSSLNQSFVPVLLVQLVSLCCFLLWKFGRRKWECIHVAMDRCMTIRTLRQNAAPRLMLILNTEQLSERWNFGSHRCYCSIIKHDSCFKRAEIAQFV